MRRNRRIAIVALAIAGVAIVLVAWPRFQESNYEGIRIRGNKAFIQRVERSLRLLQDKSPDVFQLIQRFAPYIRQSSRSGMRAYDSPPTFDLSSKTADYSESWCAGSIAHDAYHSKLYHKYLDAHGGPVPDAEWTGQAKERECIEFHTRVLKDIGAPDFEISYLSQLDGSHFDANGDGQETWADYWQRDW